jgi:hypothetical protein
MRYRFDDRQGRDDATAAARHKRPRSWEAIMTTHTRFMALGFLAGTVLIAIGVYAGVMGHRRVQQDALAAPETLIPHRYLAPPLIPYLAPVLPAPVQAAETLPTRDVADAVHEQGYEIQRLRVFVVVLAVFLLPLWIVAPIALFRRNVAQPLPVVPLTPHEVELLIRKIEDEIGSQASVPSVVRMIIELGWTPPQPSWR